MKPRIAWVCPYLPAPGTSGGAQRIQQLAANLSRDFELHLYCRGEAWELSRLNSPELELFHRRWLGRDLWHSAIPGIPRRVRRGSPRRLYKRIARDHQAAPFLAMVIEHAWAAWGAFELGIPTLLDEHNLESAYLRDWYRVRGKQGARVEHQVALMQSWERQAWRSASEIVCVSQEDAAHINTEFDRSATDSRRPAANIVPNGVSLESTPFHGMHGREPSVLFVGAMHHAPNARAAERLAFEIMPEVWRWRSDVRVDIVGPNPTAALLSANNPRLRVHGRVPSVAPFLAAASAFAFPLEHGAGTSLKTIEALAAGIPLVTTSLGARGFPLQPSAHFVPAETVIEFAQGIRSILNAPQDFEPMTRRARQVAENYDWKQLSERFRQCLERVASSGA